MGYFWGWGRVQTLFWDLLIQTNNFQLIALFLLHHVVFSLCGGGVSNGGDGCASVRLHTLNLTTVMVVLLLGL